MRRVLPVLLAVLCLVAAAGPVLAADHSPAEAAAPVTPPGEATTGSGLAWGLIGLGAALAFGLGALGTGMAMMRIGTAGVGMISENPKQLGTAIIMVAIPETMVILGFVIAYLLLNLIGKV